ncbi:MAG: twin-arginine translocase TatA/TatE family subunit [Bacteroidetes bacterium]|nr:MAG: twin-arginine translocase TatA/TatE family subunit [Bacteroidota bacterium]
MTGFILLGFLGGYEVIIVLVIIVLLFGGRKIPELMRGVGKGVKEFKKGVDDAGTKDDDPNQKKEIK